MKVLSPTEMTAIEARAFRDGASETDFMEEAGSGVALIAHDYAERHNLDRLIILLCGKGNNGGDAYVAGIHLLHLDYEVFAIQAEPIENCSPLCKQNYERFLHEGGRLAESLKEFPSKGLIIDGLFGTGFHGSPSPTYLALIGLANHSGLPIIAVDIPSGLNGETGEVTVDAIVATETAFLGLPKTGFFLRNGWNHVGKLRYIDFGLPAQYFDNTDTDYLMLSEEILKPLLPPIKRDRHKYQAGLVVGLSGSPGMPGAAILSSFSALKAGAGIVRLLHPDGMQAELASSPPELIRIPYHYDKALDVVAHLNKAAACFIGPGMGVTKESRDLLKGVIPLIEKPCVIDADALTILAEEEIQLPKNCVLTPHRGEMMRLLKQEGSAPPVTEELLVTCRRYAEKRGATLVLKGGPTFLLTAMDPIIVNPMGDPGMATAGSGDVLTGMIAALMAQGLTPKDAAALGIFLHGLAGEFAADEMTSYGMCASDIIFHFPEAFKLLMNNYF